MGAALRVWPRSLRHDKRHASHRRMVSRSDVSFTRRRRTCLRVCASLPHRPRYACARGLAPSWREGTCGEAPHRGPWHNVSSRCGRHHATQQRSPLARHGGALGQLDGERAWHDGCSLGERHGDLRTRPRGLRRGPPRCSTRGRGDGGRSVLIEFWGGVVHF